MIGLLALAAGLAVLCGATGSPARAEEVSAETIVGRIGRELARGGAQVNPGPGWDALVLVGPYTPPSGLPAPLLGDPRLRATGIEARDDVTVLVLLRQGRVASVAALPRSVLDLSPLSGRTLRPRECFGVERATPPRAATIAACE